MYVTPKTNKTNKKQQQKQQLRLLKHTPKTKKHTTTLETNKITKKQNTHTHLCRSFVPGQKKTSIYHHGGVGGPYLAAGESKCVWEQCFGGGGRLVTPKERVCVCVYYI